MDPAPTLATLLRNAEPVLAAAGIDTARLDAEVLLASVVGTNRSGLYARLHDPVDGCAVRFRELVERRARREPLAYILGHKEFHSLDFIVDPAVLIPRPETEHLIDAVVAHLGDRPARICDVGTGSGCIAVTLARVLPRCRVVAADISRPALRVARQNARRNGVSDRVRFVAADLLRGFAGKFDVIVSNPPYLRSTDARSPELDWEPQAALQAGASGLDAVAPLIASARALMKPGALLAIEIGAGQDANAMALARAAGLQSVSMQSDLAGIPRVLIGYKI